MTNVIRETQQHREMRVWLRPVLEVFKGHEASHYSLPDSLVERMAELRRVQAAIEAQLAVFPPDSVQVARSLAVGVWEGSIPADLGNRLLEAETAHEAALAQLQVLRIAEVSTAAALTDEYDTVASEIVIEGLRPALEDVLAEATKHASKLKGARTTAEVFQLQDSAASKAWFALEGLYGRYAAIRAGYDSTLRGVFAADLEQAVDPGLSRFKNYYELPKAAPATDDLGGGGVPGLAFPSERAAFMVWLSGGMDDPKPEPWLPLPDELEPVIIQARERVKEQQRAGFQQARARSAGARRAERDAQDSRDEKHVTPWRG